MGMTWDDPILEPPPERDRPTWSDLAYREWAEKEERDLEREERDSERIVKGERA